MSSWVRLAEVKMDPPVPMPNTSPADNVWLCKVKVTLVPTEDLLVHPSTEDAAAIDGLVNELNALVNWRNLYAKSPYVRACGDVKLKVPTASVPQFLVVQHAKGQPLPPVYGKMAAEWQVDHWQFSVVDMNLAVDGKPRSDYPGSTMVKGSAEAEAFLKAEHDAIAQARQQIETVRSSYADQILRGTKPGTVYTGTVSYAQNVAPCELRFLDPTPGGDARFVNFQVTLPNLNPPCWYIYKARVTTELPIPVPGTQPTPANPNPTFDFDTSNRVPEHNVFQSFVRCSNNKVGRDTLPSWLGSNDHGGQALLLLNGHIDGLINDFGNPGIKISVQQTGVAR